MVTAPDSERVDLEPPTFSDPTSITNPLFPITEQAQVVQLGVDEGEALRVEVTLLPDTKTISWDGQQIETVVSQFVGYLDEQIAEVALDFFAQADDGSVWYFGEDVFNYEDGEIADTEGTWLAGKDGPPGMIMPAAPQVGDVYRPENIPGYVFEQVTVQSVDETVDGPQGPISGALVVQELLMDGSTEDKAYAPGYGEFSAKTVDEDVSVAFGVPIDAVDGPPPAELDALSVGADDVFAAAGEARWGAAARALEDIRSGWDDLARTGVPERLATQTADAIDGLADAVATREAAEAQGASVLVTRAALDLRARHEPLDRIDLARIAAWARLIEVDAEADEPPGVRSATVVIEAIWARVAHQVDAPDTVAAAITELRSAADDGDLPAAADAATALADAVTS